MLEWLKENKAGMAIIVLALAFVVTLTACSGMRFSDWVSVRVPDGVQRAVNVPPIITLTAAETVWEDWEQHVTRETARFQESIIDANQRFSLLSNLFNTGIQIGAGAAENSGLPFAGILGTLGIALGAWFLSPPGATKKITRAKDEGYDMGAKETMNRVVAANPQLAEAAAQALAELLAQKPSKAS